MGSVERKYCSMERLEKSAQNKRYKREIYTIISVMRLLLSMAATHLKRNGYTRCEYWRMECQYHLTDWNKKHMRPSSKQHGGGIYEQSGDDYRPIQ